MVLSSIYSDQFEGYWTAGGGGGGARGREEGGVMVPSSVYCRQCFKGTGPDGVRPGGGWRGGGGDLLKRRGNGWGYSSI